MGPSFLVFIFAQAMSVVLISSEVFAQTRISFPQGSYCGQYSGDFRKTKAFVLNLGRGQTLTSRNLSTGTQWDLYVNGPAGSVPASRDRSDQLSYRIPVTGDYYIKVDSSTPYSSVEFCAY
jgi:hypothetical protein